MAKFFKEQFDITVKDTLSNAGLDRSDSLKFKLGRADLARALAEKFEFLGKD